MINDEKTTIAKLHAAKGVGNGCTCLFFQLLIQARASCTLSAVACNCENMFRESVG